MPVTLIKTEKETRQLAQCLAQCCPEKKRVVIFFEGELGAGKTFFIRAFLHSLGYQNLVRSPTYTVMENYTVGLFSIYHLDLYRFQSANEIFAMGLSDEWDANAIWLIEWPRRAFAFLPLPDILCRMAITIENYRHFQLLGQTSEGKQIIDCFNKRLKCGLTEARTT